MNEMRRGRIVADRPRLVPASKLVTTVRDRDPRRHAGSARLIAGLRSSVALLHLPRSRKVSLLRSREVPLLRSCEVVLLLRRRKVPLPGIATRLLRNETALRRRLHCRTLCIAGSIRDCRP